MSAYISDIEARRERLRAELRGPTSYLAAVARHAVPVGTRVVFGPGDDADVRLPGLARRVVVEAREDGFRVDGADAPPGAIDAGRYTLRLSHQHAPAVVVLDRESPRLREAVERRWYPIDPRYRVRAAFEPDGGAVAIASTASAARPAERVGWLRIEIDGVACRLAATRLLEPGVPADHLDVYFRDATCGAGSYPMGRYVSVERDGDAFVVDFNRAYNPACAFSPHYNCPVPPPENRLTIAIPAGEMVPVVPGDGTHG